MKKIRLLFLLGLLASTVHSQQDTTFWPTGEIRMIRTVKNDLNIQNTRTFHINGNLEEQGAVGPKGKIGEWNTYYENGMLRQVYYYGKWKLLEICASFDPKGTILPIGTSKNGKGTVFVYDDDGVLVGLREYDKGRIILE